MRVPCQPDRRVRLEFDHSTSWLDVRITELPAGRLQFQIKGKETFAGRRHGVEHNRDREAAERAVSISREYSLDAMGLAKNNGQITEEGKALLAIIRGGGRLRRTGDVLAVLRLGERLRTWTGIEDDPFQFTATGGIWVARFECEGGNGNAEKSPRIDPRRPMLRR